MELRLVRQRRAPGPLPILAEVVPFAERLLDYAAGDDRCLNLSRHRSKPSSRFQFAKLRLTIPRLPLGTASPARHQQHGVGLRPRLAVGDSERAHHSSFHSERLRSDVISNAAPASADSPAPWHNPGVMRRLIVGIALLAAACGCGTSGSPLSPSSNTLYVGSWTGQTSQSQRLAFTVTAGTVGQLEFSVNYATATCNGGMSYGSTGPLATVGGSAFAVTGTIAGPPDGPAFNFSISGRFSSPTAAEGTLQVARGPSAISSCAVDTTVTWTASRAP